MNDLTLDTATDVDNYRFKAANSGTFLISIEPLNGTNPSVNLEVRKSNGRLIARGQSSTDGPTTLRVRLRARQSYFVTVSSAQSRKLTYALRVFSSPDPAQSTIGGARPIGGAIENSTPFPLDRSDTTSSHRPGDPFSLLP